MDFDAIALPSASVDLPADLLKDLSLEKRAELIQLVSQVEVYGSFSGPLPPPEVMNRYHTEARQAIIKGFVANGAHRRTSESRGQILFFVRDILSLSSPARSLEIDFAAGRSSIAKAPRPKTRRASAQISRFTPSKAAVL